MSWISVYLRYGDRGKITPAETNFPTTKYNSQTTVKGRHSQWDGRLNTLNVAKLHAHTHTNI